MRLTRRFLVLVIVASGLLAVSPPVNAPVGTCIEDMDDDGQVGTSDLSLLLCFWGPNAGHPADFDLDGVVGMGDMLQLLANWGPCP